MINEGRLGASMNELEGYIYFSDTPAASNSNSSGPGASTAAAADGLSDSHIIKLCTMVQSFII